MRKTIKREVVEEFLHWLDYEHNLGECGYYDMTVEEIRDSPRIFDKKLANLLEALGYDSYREFIEEGG